jgi:hypothetical protein
MKQMLKQVILLFLMWLIFCPIIMAQTVVIDSVKWVSLFVDDINKGDESCKHEWKFGIAYNGDELGNYHLRKAICSLCERCEIQKQVVYSHEVMPEKTEYEVIKEKLVPSYIVTNENIKIEMLDVLEVSKAISAGDEKEIKEPIKEEPKIEIEPVIETEIIDIPVKEPVIEP